ncbi:MAG: L,D-transpeptidase, partial [Verrucomicrobiales bacterium]
MKSLSLLGLLAILPLLTNCAMGPPTPNPQQTTIKQASYVNPHAPGSYAHFTSDPSYRYTQKAWKNEKLLASANSSNTRVKIDLSDQRGLLMVGDQIAMDYRVSTGRSSHKTPTGNYTIIEKKRDKRSNLYGKIYNAEGKIINYDADTRKDTVPEGGKYVGAPMFYWMRL